MNKGMRLLANPVTALAAGTLAVAAGFNAATNKAAEFNSHFRDLANLNLDKTQKELTDLRRLVLDTSWQKGFSAKETSSAYNEVQSTIGLYGREAQQIVEKQGEFAKIMKADMGDWVAGTSKAMANWRFGVDRLDDYNKSAYAAMQVGVVSFEEIAKVQSVYAGAAASVKQDFDTANKLFSLFTIKTKSVDVAATLTKSLFNDLTKKTTVDAFKKIGINFYDMGGNLKQADQIMLELNKKFMAMKNDKAIITLKNQFAGSEGLIAMIQAATDSSGELKKTFDEFTNSKFNFDNAFANAQNDIVYRQEQLANRIDNLVIRMGQVLLPAKEWAVGLAERAVSNLDWMTKSTSEQRQSIQESQDKIVSEKYGGLLSQAGTMSEDQFNTYMRAIKADIKQYKDQYDQKTGKLSQLSKLDPVWGHLGSLIPYETRMARVDKESNNSRQYDLARSKAFQRFAGDFQQAWINRGATPAAGNTPTGATSDTVDTTGLGNSVGRIVGSAKTPRVLNINIDAFNKGGITTQNTAVKQMNDSQLEEWFTNLCMRAIYNVETSYN